MVFSLISDERCSTFFQYFGLAVFSYYGIRWCFRLWNNFSTFFLGFGRLNLKKYGSWAGKADLY